MLIEKHENSWSFAGEEYIGLWHLAYTDAKMIIGFFQSEKTTSTSANLYVASEEECKQYIIDNELMYETWPVEEEPTVAEDFDDSLIDYTIV